MHLTDTSMEELGIEEIQERFADGTLSSVELVAAFLERIERIDGLVNAVIETNPDALEIAERLDAERRAGRARGPLHGIPILLKDNIDTHDRCHTTCGSIALKGHIARKDADVVDHLRNAGAVLLGKTNLSEWAGCRGRRTVSGWSSLGGLTRNPHALDRSPEGSSSGAAAAIASYLACVAVGTETDGSLVHPASTNGIVGLRPTLGLVDREGIIPVSSSFDTPGPLARSVADLAVLLDGMVRRTKGCHARQANDDAGFRAALRPNGLRGARIGVARNLAGTDPRIHAVFQTALDVMKELGAILIDPVEGPVVDYLQEAKSELILRELKLELDRYLERSTAPVRSLDELIRFNEAHRETALAYFGQEYFETAATKTDGLRDKLYRKTLITRVRYAARKAIDRPLRKHCLDAIVAPSGGPACLIDMTMGDMGIHWDVERNSTPCSAAGYPHLTVPAGTLDRMPIGISFIGGAWQERTLLRLAHAFEQKANARIRPLFISSVNRDKLDDLRGPAHRSSRAP